MKIGQQEFEAESDSSSAEPDQTGKPEAQLASEKTRKKNHL